MMTRRTLLAGLPASLAPLAGCHTDGAAPELSIWQMWSGQEERNWLAVLQAYQKRKPDFRFRNLGGVRDDTKTIRALVAGSPPDLFTLADAGFLSPMAHNRAILPLDDLFHAAGLREADFVAGALNLCRYRGKLYGIPYLIDNSALLWDKKAFREVGLDPEQPPRTLEELAEFAAKLTKINADGSLSRIGLRPPDDAYLLMTLFGGSLADPQSERITADHPGNIAALEWYRSTMDKQGGMEKVRAFASGFGQLQGASNPFYVGKVAMIINGEWNPYWLSRYAPHVEYGVAPIPPPAAHPENRGMTWIGGNVFCIPAETKHKDAVWEFLTWTQSREAQILFARAMNNVPNQKAVLHAPELREGAPFRKKYSVFLDLAEQGKSAYFPPLPVSNLYMNQMNNAIDEILLGMKPTAQALREVRERVQQEMERQKG
jgi:multiple sugar transport system substrate-binding protein